jgi:hypothetical protein
MGVISEQPDVPALPLGGFMPNNEPIEIRNIDGLGPVKSEISTTPFATGRGNLFQDAFTGMRNIVITFGLNPNWADQSITSLRQLLYSYFMVERFVTLQFSSDELPTVQIKGIVESLEPNMFSQDPEIQVSILCPSPDFLDVNLTTITGEVNDAEVVVDYVGTVRSGFVLKIERDTAAYVGDLTILNTVRGKDQFFLLTNVTVSFAKWIELNSLRTSRHVYNISPAGVVTDILTKIAGNPTWPEFLAGENRFSVTGDTSNLAWTISYYNRYGGL